MLKKEADRQKEEGKSGTHRPEDRASIPPQAKASLTGLETRASERWIVLVDARTANECGMDDDSRRSPGIHTLLP